MRDLWVMGSPRSETFDRWHEETPAGFRYALKYSRYGTHMKRLKDPESHVGHFVERARRLGDALGPVLVQLPPNWGPDPARLDTFLAATPDDLSWVVEVRDRAWLEPEVFAVLRQHGAALCVHDMLSGHPREATGDLVYLRFHGPSADYTGSYSPQALTAAARRIRKDLEAGRDVWAYFNNDDAGHAVANALDLARHTHGNRGAR